MRSECKAYCTKFDIKIVHSNLNNNNGMIIRTASENQNEEVLIKDIKYVQEINDVINENAKKNIENNNFPEKLYEAGGIMNKVLLGLIDSCERITVNSKEVYDFIKSDYSDYSKDLILDKKDNILSEDIDHQLEKLRNRKIWLNCGGFITIDKNEALTAIDVNTGKYTGKESLENTVFKVNEEATVEIARQLRARDIGGIVIIDYIDMEEKENEEKIVHLMEKELKKDRAKTQVIGFTPLHLLEMTRKHLCSN